MDLLGQQITVSMVVSLIISAIIAIATFAVGIRVGKERTDRGLMRGHYKALFDHFTDLSRRLSKGEPKQWPDFPLKNDGYYPPVRELERTGEINMLPVHIAHHLQELERDVLILGSELHRALADEGSRAAIETLGSLGVEGSQHPNGKPTASLSLGALVLRNDKEFSAFCSHLTNNANLSGVGLGGKLADGKLWTKFISFDDTAPKNAPDVFSAVRSSVSTAIGEHRLNRLPGIQIRLEEANRMLAARIRDPHPFSETALSFWHDIFDQSAR